MVANPEELKRNVLLMIGTALKTIPSAASIDHNQILFALDRIWPKLFLGGLLDLNVLYKVLLEKAVPLNDAALVCLMVHKREDRLGVEVRLPKMVQTLPPALKEQLLDTATRTAQTALTNAPIRQATQLPKGPGDGMSGSTSRGQPVDAGEPVIPAFTPPSQRKKLPVSPATIALCGLLVVIAIVFNLAIRDKGIEEAKVNLPPGAEGFVVKREDNNFYFFDPQKNFDRPKTELDALGPKLYASIRDLGGTRAWMCLKEDERCRRAKAVVRESQVVHLKPKTNEPPKH